LRATLASRLGKKNIQAIRGPTVQLSTIHHSNILKKVCILSSPRNALAARQQTFRDDSSSITRQFHVAALRKAAELQGIKLEKQSANRGGLDLIPHPHEHLLHVRQLVDAI
jgi:hypothetical protein